MNYYVFSDEQDVNNYLEETFEGKLDPNFIAYQDNHFHTTNLKYLTRFQNFVTSNLTIGSTNYLYNKITIEKLEVTKFWKRVKYFKFVVRK